MHNQIRAINSDNAIGVNLWSGAMTPYSDYPSFPSFRRLIIDAETMLPIKVETWAIDIT
jgi:hypothetical protein